MPAFDPADLDDIPGTTIFTVARSRQAYQLHRFYHVPASNTAVGHIVLRPIA